MNRWIRSISLSWASLTLGIVLASIPSAARATWDCPVCLEPVNPTQVTKRKAIECSSRHRTHQRCLFHQIENLPLLSLEQAAQSGVPCGGRDLRGGRCLARLPADQVRQVLGTQSSIFQRRLVAAASARTEEPPPKAEYWSHLQEQIQEAFNLTCPETRCRATLDQIEGCNAATCSQCGAHFCYLCLQQYYSSAQVHEHAKEEHSGAYWEFRPGYTSRYHWLLTRERLNFLTYIGPDLKSKAIESLQPMLEERKFWPIPVGKPAQQWIEEVRDSSLSTSDQIELLQNEAIFRSTSLDLDAAQIRAAIRSLGGKALRSLDIQANDLSPCGLVQEFVFRLTDQCLSELAVRCCGRRR